MCQLSVSPCADHTSVLTCCLLLHATPPQVDGGMRFSLAHDVAAGGNSVHFDLAARKLNLVLRL